MNEPVQRVRPDFSEQFELLHVLVAIAPATHSDHKQDIVPNIQSDNLRNGQLLMKE
ncbi:hypothetical protein [Rubripirellula reticaptiva]|uniref:hypothetical protein n=1 Tax=Rubripirellula reticaptiva TaxID=2528013 RepID=UPI0016485DB6|nr:hypothetical protein [Rubripirellula reticaptiva]